VDIVYSPTFDAACAFATGYEIKDEWQHELKSRLNEFHSEGSSAEAELLSTTEKIVGKPLMRRSATARVTLCDTPSRSSPLLVNMRYALASFTSSPVPMHVKVGTLYHELLHNYIADFLPPSSDLLQQYTHEHARVTGHLHLLALQKAVYLE
jgi:hypothetical protein